MGTRTHNLLKCTTLCSISPQKNKGRHQSLQNSNICTSYSLQHRIQLHDAITSPASVALIVVHLRGACCNIFVVIPICNRKGGAIVTAKTSLAVGSIAYIATLIFKKHMYNSVFQMYNSNFLYFFAHNVPIHIQTPLHQLF